MSGCVQSNQYRSLDNRVTFIESQLSEIKQQLTVLEKSTEIDTENLTQKYADLSYQLDQLQEKGVQAENRLEDLNTSLGIERSSLSESQAKDLSRMDEAISKNYERLIQLEKYVGLQPAKTVDSKANQKAQSSPPLKKLSEEETYKSAKAFFDKGDFEKARSSFEDFISKFPDSTEADNARFWIGDSYYAEKWFENAILEYQKVLKNYPKSNKVAAARLKQGYAFAELGEKANAQLVLNELIKYYPNTNEAKYAQAKISQLK